jgi:hypothetical protein
MSSPAVIQVELQLLEVAYLLQPPDGIRAVNTKQTGLYPKIIPFKLGSEVQALRRNPLKIGSVGRIGG